MDPRLQVYDPSMELLTTLACNNVCSTSGDLDLTADGTFTLLMFDSGLNEGGRYEIGLQCILGDCPDVAPNAWENLSSALSGARGRPVLYGEGTLEDGTPAALQVAKAAPSTLGILVAGFTRIDVPFAGGVLVPSLESLCDLRTDAQGQARFDIPSWPGGLLPSGTEMYAQVWLVDPSAPFGLSASNAVRGIQP